jgi:hypothetical protein
VLLAHKRKRRITELATRDDTLNGITYHMLDASTIAAAMAGAIEVTILALLSDLSATIMFIGAPTP